MALPHITNSQAGVNRQDPVHSNLYQISFTLPEALRAEFGQDEAVISEQVLSITGLDVRHKTAETGTQKFMGTSRSYIQSGVSDTYADLEVKFALNLRNGTDNYVYKLFKAWSRLGYDINTGAKVLKKDYVTDTLTVMIGNRVGDIYEQITFKDVMLNGPITGLDELNYDTLDAVELTVKFRSDWWDDVDL